MRTLKYRGKIDGVWQYWMEDDAHQGEYLAASQFWNMVDRKTVGEFTGLLDKRGKEVYEGDILQITSGRVMQVIWHESAFCWDLLPLNSEGIAVSFAALRHTDFAIIGNMYDNPELLEVKL